ncbi:hypothetical protein CPB86DRAFT_736976 [Serendipita vermifera]|nr:hypothetical protein CPB86DRAFT_736976 [Serendipita vermifera]
MDEYAEGSRNTSRSSLAVETRTRRRSSSSERYGKDSPRRIPGTQLYATPWDANAPEKVAHEEIRGPLLPPKPKRARSESEEQLPLNPFTDSPLPDDNYETKKVRFPRSLSGTTFDEERSIVFEDFGSVPNSANSRTEFLSSSAPRSVLRNRKRSSSLWVPAKHPWWPHYFEPVPWPPLLTLSITVLVSYPLLVVTVFAARGWSLFWTRFIVGFSTSVLGFMLGLGLMEIGKRLLESATWATIVHHSMYEGRSQVTLGALEAKSRYPHFVWLGLSLLWERLTNRTTLRRRRPYDKKPWILFVLFFIVIAMGSTCMAFLLGRLVDIVARDEIQEKYYNQVAISGDLDEEDLIRAEKHVNATKDFTFTWTLSPFGSSEQASQPVKLQWEGQDIYFSELTHGILSGATGSGSFMTSDDDDKGASQREGLRDVPGTAKNDQAIMSSATLVRYTRWGIRIQCAKLPNPERNIIPWSPGNLTYAYIPQSTIDGLTSKLGLPNYAQTPDPTRFLQNNDTVPESVDLSQMGFVGYWWNNGVAHSFKSTPLEYGSSGNGWVELDVMMVRLETMYAPGGTFKARSEDGKLGFDAAVCVEAIEPWVVDTYNATTGRVTTLRIAGKGDLSTVHLNYGKQKNRSIKGLSMGVNSTGKLDVFGLAHGNSRNQILKDNGRDFWYVPNPTLISWSGGNGPQDFTSLQPEFLEAAMGSADATQLLPYLIGSKSLVAYQYPVKTTAFAHLFVGPTIGSLAVILLVGFAAAFLVPRLPLGIPRRDFSVFTWLAAFEGDGMIHQAVKQNIERNMDLEELRRRYGEQKISYGT